MTEQLAQPEPAVQHPHLEQYPSAEQDPARAEAMAHASKYMTEYAMGIRDAKNVLQVQDEEQILSGSLDVYSARGEGAGRALGMLHGAHLEARTEANRLAEEAGVTFDERKERQDRQKDSV